MRQIALIITIIMMIMTQQSEQSGTTWDHDCDNPNPYYKNLTECPRDYIQMPGTNTCYRAYCMYRRQASARNHCLLQGGSLVTVSSVKINRHLHYILNGRCLGLFWTGLRDRSNKGNLEWVHCHDNFLNETQADSAEGWTHGRDPVNKTVLPTKDKSCITMSVKSRRKVGIMRSAVCSDYHFFFCQIRLYFQHSNETTWPPVSVKDPVQAEIDLAETKKKKKEEARLRLQAIMEARNRTARGRRAPPTSNAQTPMELYMSVIGIFAGLAACFCAVAAIRVIVTKKKQRQRIGVLTRTGLVTY